MQNDGERENLGAVTPESRKKPIRITLSLLLIFVVALYVGFFFIMGHNSQS